MTEENTEIAVNELDQSEAQAPVEELESTGEETEQVADSQNDETEEKQASERTRRRREQRRFARERRERDARLEAEKEAAYYRGQLEALKVQEPGKPNQEDFDDYNDYVEALTDWKVEQRMKPKEPAQPQAPDNGPHISPEVVESFNNSGTEKFGADFEDMMEAARNGEFACSADMAEYMFSESVGPDMAMHFYDHPDEAKKIANLSPRAQMRALDKLATAFSGESKDTPREQQKISQAPPPVKPERGESSAGADTLEKAAARRDMAAYSRLRAKQRQANGYKG